MAHKYRRLPQIQFIAALGNPESRAGSGARSWGLWRVDPGPRGVPLVEFRRLLSTAAVKFDPTEWWIEEHGLLMEKPEPLGPGRYLVTGDREVTTELEIRDDGTWSLAEGTLFDVTHLPCRAARYHGGSPEAADLGCFPVIPGAAMPEIPGSRKTDYAVIFVIGVA